MKDLLVIVPCGKAKIWDKHPGAGPTAARDAYIGSLFKVDRGYAEHFAETWVVLSAKYGFILPDFVICCNYDVTFKDPATNPVTVPKLKGQIDELLLGRCSLVIGLGGAGYRKVVERAFAEQRHKLRFPFAGLNMFEMMAAVKEAVRIGQPLWHGTDP